MLIGFLLHTGTNGEKLTGKTLIELPFPISTSMFCLAGAGYSLFLFLRIYYTWKRLRGPRERELFGWLTN